jgi:DNA-directed RNA polymerase subunit RPC12/RpoP
MKKKKTVCIRCTKEFIDENYTKEDSARIWCNECVNELWNQKEKIC